MKQLLFVYHAESDLFNAVSDFAHKILSPSTYPCKLCTLTHGNFAMKQEWKRFIQSLPVQTAFLHMVEFKKQHSGTSPLPAVFLRNDGTLEEIISKEEIEACDTLEELKKVVIDKLQQHDQHNHTHIQRGG